jgi:formylglycine-generating enzyme required for sulfatase activity
LALVLPTIALAAHAATREKAPPESVAQVDAALQTLATAFGGKARTLKPGTIESAIYAYAPLKYWPVEEGTLPAPQQGVRCPSEMVDVAGRFCIDRYEGSLVEKTAAGMTPWTPYEPPAGGRVYLARSVAGVVPQAYISAAQAEAACRAANKRLCAPVEWRAACGGSQGYAYPYGSTRTAGKCHDSGVAPMIVYHLAEMKKGWGLPELNDPRNNQLDGTVAKTGAFPDCVNDYGAYDMVGNLHEWTADPNGTFQGGYWLDTAQHGDGCAYRTISHGYTYHDYSTGFRCCASTEATASR